ncbi:uncharacterized protein LOC114529427 [Dendronephthya gigantea]|uniref:uncharacterized protein LOC114529427 n=1 Tax=Dendronephthya gigantea TaxID=151771 RepID=UPI00106C85BE|nr:uncharacterized protein LOC114529427 [Dendronephthya gigantea]
MSEVITGLLKAAFGLISNKIRDYSAEKLQDGGLVDQKFRGLIVRELDDISSKLDAISRKELLTSISFLKQGIDRLGMALEETFKTMDQPTVGLPIAGASSNETKPAQSVTVEEAVTLANAIQKLKIISNERFSLANESFKEAGKQASLAFNITTLYIEERILATKVRITSGILQNLNDPELAANDCLQCLRELNSLPAVQDIFYVHSKGGIKSFIEKKSRSEIVETVTMINLVLADFITRFTTRRMSVFEWPMIECGKRVIHPVHYDKSSLPNIKRIKITPPWDVVAHEEGTWRFERMQNGQILYFLTDRCVLKKLGKTGELQMYTIFPPFEENSEHSQFTDEDKFARTRIYDVAVDEDGTVYALSSTDSLENKLSVYSADGSTQHHPLKFLEAKDNDKSWRGIAVTNDKKIVITEERFESNFKIFLCKSNGELLNGFDTGPKFRSEDHVVKDVSVTSDDEIVLLTKNLETRFNMIGVFKEDGKLQRAVKFRTSDGKDTYRSLFYNQASKTIVAFDWDFRDDDWAIMIDYLSDQTAERKRTYVLRLNDTNLPNLPEHLLTLKLTGHTNGALALVSEKHFISLHQSCP